MKRKKIDKSLCKLRSSTGKKRRINQQKNTHVKTLRRKQSKTKPLPLEEAKMISNVTEAVPPSVEHSYALPGNEISDNFTSQDTITCVVCLDTRNLEETSATPCGHTFHKDCLEMWLQNGNYCPICRIQLNDAVAQESQTSPVHSMRSTVLRNLNSMRERFAPTFNSVLTDIRQHLRRNFDSTRERLVPRLRLVYARIRDQVRENADIMRQRFHPYSSFTFEQNTPDGRVKLSMHYVFGCNVSSNLSLSQ